MIEVTSYGLAEARPHPPWRNQHGHYWGGFRCWDGATLGH